MSQATFGVLRKLGAALVGVSVLGVVGATGQAVATSNDTQTATVVRVVDGDTIRVRVGGVERTVRMIGVNTPETVKPNAPVECWGKQASALTKRLLPPGSAVTLHKDTSDTDRYGRWLRYVHKGSVDIGKTLLNRGAASVMTFPPDDERALAYLRAESAAKAKPVGMWANCPTRT